MHLRVPREHVDLMACSPADELDGGTAGGTRGEVAAARPSWEHAPVTGRRENGARIRCTGARRSSPCSRLGRRSEDVAGRRRTAELSCRRWGRRRGRLQSLRETTGEGGETAKKSFSDPPLRFSWPRLGGDRRWRGDLAGGQCACVCSALCFPAVREKEQRERERAEGGEGIRTRRRARFWRRGLATEVNKGGAALLCESGRRGSRGGA